MKKIRFLIKLNEQGTLRIVDPSEEISESYIKKSESHFESAKILLNSEKLEESVSMAYYGMYHVLLALLFKCGIKSENHSASILILKELFGKQDLAREISFSKKERIDKQYYTDFKLTKQDCEDMIKKTENFIIEIKRIIKHLSQADSIALREDLRKSLISNKKSN
ncbi:MAG: HEPN domain-containing protein [Nanoarchaeota archaeon]